MRGFRFRSMAWPLVYSAFGRRRVGLRQTWLIWFRRSTRENKRFCAIEGEEPLVDFVTREQDVWSRQFYSHDGQNILSQPNKNASNHFLRKSSYSLWQKRIPSRAPPPPTPRPCAPWSSRLGCSSYFNEFTDTAGSKSLYVRQFFHCNNHFFFP